MAYSKLDFGQIMKYVYDEATESLKTTPSDSTSFEIELDATDGDSVNTGALAQSNTVLQNGISADTGDTTSAVDVSNYRGIYISVIADSLNAADGEVKLQASSDGTNFADVSSASVTLASGNSVNHIIVDYAPYVYFRLVYTEGSNTAGTVTTQYNLKG